MRNQIIKNVLLIGSAFLLTSCGFFEKDNTPEPKPLVHITPEIKPTRLWSTQTGSGIGDEYAKMGPALTDTAVITASANGIVTSVNKATGNKNWQVNTGAHLSTSPGAGDGIVVVGGRKGEIIALSQADGRERFRTSIPGEILARPAIAKNIVIIKAVDGYIRALSATDGHELWSFQQVEPNLILSASSAPLIRDHNIVIGFANGNLAKFSLRDGQLLWRQPIAIPEGAFAIQRMIDIDADPILYDHQIFAATYQGRIASLDWTTGRVLWSHDISSYTGMVADANTVYIADTKGYVWAFNTDSGLVNWRQTDLEARIVTGPTAIGNYVVVGDAQGYIHWLNKRDGHFAAREYVGAMYSAPAVEDNVLYALNNSGKLVAYRLN